MNNKKKSLVAGLAGAALLIGGGSTFALWQTEADLGESVSISVGTTSVVATIDWNSPQRVWVPGDTAEGFITIDASLVGDNLRATLSNNAGDAAVGIDAEIARALANFVEVDVRYAEAIPTLESGDHNVIVPITVEFVNQGETWWNTDRTLYTQGMEFNFNIEDLRIILTQEID